jgi:ubiquitin carboxyl-terminal hydrolase 14
VVPELVGDLQKYTGGTNNLDAGSNMTASLRDLYKELNGAGYSVTPLVFLNVGHE